MSELARALRRAKSLPPLAQPPRPPWVKWILAGNVFAFADARWYHARIRRGLDLDAAWALALCGGLCGPGAFHE
jgi:hypothetical protein